MPNKSLKFFCSMILSLAILGYCDGEKSVMGSGLTKKLTSFYWEVCFAFFGDKFLVLVETKKVFPIISVK